MLPVEFFQNATDLQTLTIAANLLRGDYSEHVYALTRLTWLNVSNNADLVLSKQPWVGLRLRLLDVSFSSITPDPSMCSVGLALSLRGMRSNATEMQPVIAQCSGTVDVLDLSSNGFIVNPQFLQSAMQESQKTIPITRDDYSQASTAYTIIQLRDIPVSCILSQEGRYRKLPQSMVGSGQTFYNVLPSIVYKCRCSPGYSMDSRGHCYVFWSSGRIATVTLGVFSIAAIIATLATLRWYRRRRSGFIRSLDAKDYLLSEANADLDLIRQSWQIRWEDITVGECIGSGTYGTVHSCLWMSRHVACKQLHKEMSSRQFAAFEAEAAAMSGLRHPNIVSFFGAGTDDDGRGFLVVELMSAGSLRSVLDDPNAPLPWPTRLRFCNDICAGMLFLHTREPPMLHRDLKADNVLLDDRWVAKVSDFGTLRSLSQRGGQMAQMRDRTPPSSTQLLATAGLGTPLWTAPEVTTSARHGMSQYSTSADVYSFAVVLFEIATRQLPWAELDSASLFKLRGLVEDGHRPRLPEGLSLPEGFLQIMEQSWDQDPLARPSFATLSTLMSQLQE